MKKIFVATSSFDKSLTRMYKNYEFVFNPLQKKLTENELSQFINNDTIGIIAGLEVYNSQILDLVPNLKVISRCGVGIDNIDIEQLSMRKIVLHNTPQTHVDAVAELTLGLILGLIRHVGSTYLNLRNNIWNKKMGSLLKNKTVGIIGFGNVGKRLYELLMPFNVQVLAFDSNMISDINDVKFTDLNYLMTKSDIISVHLPKTINTINLIDSSKLELMRESAYLINTSRGLIVNEKALYNALNNNRIAGAAIDVYEKEPYSGKLLELENVLLTPHIGSYAIESRENQEKEALLNLIKEL